LDYYKPIHKLPGFVSVVQRRIRDLKRAHICPEDFLADTHHSPPRLHELSLIYQTYQSLLEEIAWADREGTNWLAVEQLEIRPQFAPAWKLLVLDGFGSFTQLQHRALELLAERLPEIIITLPGTAAMTRAAHQRFKKTLEELSVLPHAVLEDFSPHQYLSPPLRHLEENLAETGAGKMSAQGKITFIEARSPGEEAREALRWIKGLVVREKIDLNRCAVIIPDTERYHPYLRSVGREFNLPLHFSKGTALDKSPAFLALLGALELHIKDYPRRLVLDTIRSPYFNLEEFNLCPESAALLDRVSAARQILAGRQVWLETLEALSHAAPDQYSREDKNYSIKLPVGEGAAALQQGFSRLTERLSPPERAQNLVEWVAWLEDLLETLHYWQSMQQPGNNTLLTENGALLTSNGLSSSIGLNANDRTSLDSFRQMLRELVLVETATGEKEIDYRQFVQILRDGAASQIIQQPSHMRQPGVMVLHTTEGRGLRHQAVAVLGLSEGLFPGTQRGDPFLDEETRARLGMASAFDPHSLGLFYLAVTRTDLKLLLTRPYLAEGGEEWEASPFWGAALRLFTDRPVRLLPDAPRPVEQAASPQEALVWSLQRGSIPKKIDIQFHDRIAALRRARDIINARLASDPGGQFDGQPVSVKEHINPDFSSGSMWSASRLEMYQNCPFYFYAKQVLNLEAQVEPELGMDVMQRGRLLHQILERVYREAEDPAYLDSLSAKLAQVVLQEFGDAPVKYGFRPSPLWSAEQDELLGRLEKTITELHGKSEGWRPLKLEAFFGLSGAPPLRIDLENEQIFLRGVIDRIDRDAEGGLRIIDYKTGSSKLGAAYLRSGERLQLPLYALAARDALALGQPVEGFYWAIFGAKAGSLKLSSFKDDVGSGPQAAYRIARTYVAGILSGMRAVNFVPKPPRDGCPGYCPAAGWCWRYVPERRFW